mgnify:CR=1 FL=1
MIDIIDEHENILLIAFPLGRLPLCLKVGGRLCSGATIRGCLLMLFVNGATDSSKGARMTALCAFSLREVSVFTMNCFISSGSGGLTEQLSSEGSLCLSTAARGGCCSLGGDVDSTDLCCGLATSSSSREGMGVAGCSCCLAERIQSTCDI